jgi:hypothetical protein
MNVISQHIHNLDQIANGEPFASLDEVIHHIVNINMRKIDVETLRRKTVDFDVKMVMKDGQEWFWTVDLLKDIDANAQKAFLQC